MDFPVTVPMEHAEVMTEKIFLGLTRAKPYLFPNNEDGEDRSSCLAKGEKRRLQIQSALTRIMCLTNFQNEHMNSTNTQLRLYGWQVWLAGNGSAGGHTPHLPHHTLHTTHKPNF